MQTFNEWLLIENMVQWAQSTKDPAIMDFVDKLSYAIRKGDTERFTGDIQLIQAAMQGDQMALQKLKQRAGTGAFTL
jgi:hypothetical protein